MIRARYDVSCEAPDTLPAGLTNIRLVNDGPAFHHVWIIGLDAGRTLRDLLEQTKSGGVDTSRFENGARQPHEALVVKLEEGRTVEDFLQFIQTPEARRRAELQAASAASAATAGTRSQ